MIGMLLSLAAFTSAALAQNLTISQPPAGSKLAAGSAFTIKVERLPPSDHYKDIAIVIAASSCEYGCSDGLGHDVLYNGPFSPQTSGGFDSQNFFVTAPNSFNGHAQITVAHFYLEGLTNVLKEETAKSTVTITGATG